MTKTRNIKKKTRRKTCTKGKKDIRMFFKKLDREIKKKYFIGLTRYTKSV